MTALTSVVSSTVGTRTSTLVHTPGVICEGRMPLTIFDFQLPLSSKCVKVRDDNLVEKDFTVISISLGAKGREVTSAEVTVLAKRAKRAAEKVEMYFMISILQPKFCDLGCSTGRLRMRCW